MTNRDQVHDQKRVMVAVLATGLTLLACLAATAALAVALAVEATPGPGP
ncbi:hypothetical protein [Streptomyces sp. NPDC093109]